MCILWAQIKAIHRYSSLRLRHVDQLPSHRFRPLPFSKEVRLLVAISFKQCGLETRFQQKCPPFIFLVRIHAATWLAHPSRFSGLTTLIFVESTSPPSALTKNNSIVHPGVRESSKGVRARVKAELDYHSSSFPVSFLLARTAPPSLTGCSIILSSKASLTPLTPLNARLRF
jgi:hypothetical protein